MGYLEIIISVLLLFFNPPEPRHDKVRLAKMEVERLNSKYEDKVDNVDITFTGLFVPSGAGGVYKKRYNLIDIPPEILITLNDNELIKVIRHEFAHAITLQNNKSVKDFHNEEFVKWANKLNGFEKERTNVGKIEVTKEEYIQIKYFVWRAYIVRFLSLLSIVFTLSLFIPAIQDSLIYLVSIVI